MNSIHINHTFCTSCTIPISVCICALAPNLQLPIATHILFHPNELQRRNSSGRLLKNCLKIESTVWHRLKNKELENTFKDFALLYPEEKTRKTDSDPLTSSFKSQNPTLIPKGFLWLDATWQESRKMLRQSPWLDKLPKYKISAHTGKDLPESQYILRRNQTSEGLSTIETFAYWLHEQNQPNNAQDLLNFFNQFQSAFLKARNSGQFK